MLSLKAERPPWAPLVRKISFKQALALPVGRRFMARAPGSDLKYYAIRVAPNNVQYKTGQLWAMFREGKTAALYYYKKLYNGEVDDRNEHTASFITDPDVGYEFWEGWDDVKS